MSSAYLNVLSDSQFPVNAHTPRRTVNLALTSLIPPADSAHPLYTTCLELPAALLSPLSYVFDADHYLLLPVPSCLLCFFSSLPQLSRYSTSLLCDKWLLIKGMLGLNAYKPASNHLQLVSACALKHNNMAFLYWHELHIKNDINDMTFYNVLFSLAVSFLPVYPLNALTCSLHVYIENSNVVYALKEIPQGAKDTKDSNLTILPCNVNLIPTVLVRYLVQNKPNN